MSHRIDPRLYRLFQDEPGENLLFLEKLDKNEQILLEEIIRRRIDAEGGAILSTIGMFSNLLPAFLRAKIAQDALGPALSARISAYMPVKHALGTAKSLKVEFMADMAVHMQPEKMVEMIEKAPDSLMLSVTKQLLKKGRYDILAGFSDHLSPGKLSMLAQKLGSTRDILEVGYRMKDSGRLIETALTFSDKELIEMMKGINQLAYYDMAAKVGQFMDMDRQIRLLYQLDPQDAARIASHYPPEVIAEIIPRVDREMGVNIGLYMDPVTLGSLFNRLPVSVINEYLPYFSVEKVKESIPFINLKKIENHWEELSPSVNDMISRMGRDDPRLAELLEQVKGNLEKNNPVSSG